MTSNFAQSGHSNPCPVCGRTHDDGCSIAVDGKTVLCRSKAHNGQVPEPPDEINGWKWTGRIDCNGVLERAIYLPAGWQKPQLPKADLTFDYPDADGSHCVRTRRVDKGNGKKLIWQEYWIEDKTLAKFTVTGHWVKLGKDKGTPDERRLYEQHRQDLITKVRLFKIDQALTLHQETGRPLLIVEGETAVLALLKLGIPATTAIGGAGKFEQYGCSNYLIDLEPFKSVVVCPDCDEDGRKHAESIARHRPDARWLYANPAHARWRAATWTSGYDVGNWIAEGATAEQILSAIEDRRIGVSVDSATAETEGDSATEEIQYEIQDDAATPDHHLNKHFFKEGKGDYCTMDGAWFRHCVGGWEHIDDEDMQQIVSEELKKLYVKKKEQDGDEVYYRKIHKFAGDRNTNSAYRFNLKNLAVSQRRRPDPTNYINFLNGVLDVKNNKFRDYDRSLYLTSQIQANYTVGADCPADLQAFIDTAYGHEKTELIRAVIRYYLDPSLTYGFFVHLIGGSRSGKGTLIHFIGEMLGKSYKSANEFSILNSPELRHQHLTGARMMAFPDVTNALNNLGAFYELVDNGAMAGRPLFSGTAFTKRWDTRFIMASTQPMAFERSDAGWDKRCVPISTLGNQGEIDDSWEGRLKSCLADAVSWAMGLGRDRVMEVLRNPIKFAIDYQALKDIQSISSDSVQAFIDACLAPSDDAEPISKATIYGWYKAYCDANKLGTKGFTNFCARMRTALGELFEVPRTSRRVAGKVVNIAAQYQKLELSSSNLFTLKSMPSGEELPPERAEFVCNTTNQSEGGLSLFRDYVISCIQSNKDCSQVSKTLTAQESQVYQVENSDFKQKNSSSQNGSLDAPDQKNNSLNRGSQEADTPEYSDTAGVEGHEYRKSALNATESVPPAVGDRVFVLTRGEWGRVHKINSDGWLQVVADSGNWLNPVNPASLLPEHCSRAEAK